MLDKHYTCDNQIMDISSVKTDFDFDLQIRECNTAKYPRGRMRDILIGLCVSGNIVIEAMNLRLI